MTFVDPTGDLPQLRLGSSALTGTGAAVSFATVSDANLLGGAFRLALGAGGQQSAAIPAAATAAELAAALQGLAFGPGGEQRIGAVHVSREAAPANQPARQGYTWWVTCVSNAGDLPLLVADASALTGAGSPAVAVREHVRGAAN
ncbi:MAG: hypothetical protein ACK4MU_09350, partial [Thermomonas sp.]